MVGAASAGAADVFARRSAGGKTAGKMPALQELSAERSTRRYISQVRRASAAITGRPESSSRMSFEMKIGSERSGKA
jgi:hypothetical protein